MRQQMKRLAVILITLCVLAGFSATVWASDDNSLQGLGITTEGVTVSPEFAYDTWSYDVTVPAGTTTLELAPQPSSSAATIASVTGTELNPDGTGTVLITVRAESGAEFTYTLNVTSAPGEPAAVQEQTQPAQTETPQTDPPQTEAPTEPQTEDSRFVRVDKNTIEEAQNTITSLKGEITGYRDTISLYTRIMYGLIGLAVILLFIIINLILRKRDLKAELNEYRKMGFTTGKKAKKMKAAGNANMPQQGPNAPVKAPGGANAAQMQGAPHPAQPVGQPIYRRDDARLEVTPQVSSRKNRTLPSYQEEMPVNQQAPAQQGGPGYDPAGAPVQEAPAMPDKAQAKAQAKAAKAEAKAQAKAAKAEAKARGKEMAQAEAPANAMPEDAGGVMPEAQPSDEPVRPQDVQINMIDL